MQVETRSLPMPRAERTTLKSNNNINNKQQAITISDETPSTSTVSESLSRSGTLLYHSSVLKLL